MRSLPALTWRECFQSYLVRSPAQEIQTNAGSRPRGQFYSPVFAYFCLFSLYFRVNRLGKSHRNAIINYLHESKTKIRENPRWSSTSGSNDTLSLRRAG